jgi:hypothetical protein
MKSLSQFIFETSPLTPFWAAWFAGFVVIAGDGKVYRTAAGQSYLDERDAGN